MADLYTLFLGRFGRFTEIQELALPKIRNGKNCIITAPTGSGKTEAALLPVLEMIKGNNEGRGIFAIYITPLRALNRDLVKRLEWLCSEAGISMGARHGDTTAKERAAQAANPPHLIITTPETLQNLFFSPRLREALKSTRIVIVDELHELYYNKRGAQLSIALERLEELAPRFQRIGISATIGDIDEVSSFLFGKRENEIIRSGVRKRFDISIEMPMVPKRRHEAFEQAFSLDDQSLARIERVSDIINSSGATLVFANTRQVVESLGSKLVYLNRLEGIESVGIHHSSLDKQERIEIENSFKEGKLKGIIATSSLELGIDIGKIDHVVQYGSPRQAGRLIQRIGRGGHREGEISKGHILVSGALEALESASAAVAAEKNELERHRMEKGALDVLLNQVSAIALEYRKIEVPRLFSIIRRAAPYADLSMETLNRVIRFGSDLHLMRQDGDSVSISSRTRKYFFGNISVIPDSPRFNVKDAVRNRIISTLDERFVSNYLEEGSSFITRGIPWKVLSIEEGTVFVEPATEFESAIPDWEGEDIPVSYNIASFAMRLFDDEKVLERVLDKDAYANVSGFLKEQRSLFVPSGKRIVVETVQDYVILYTPLGKQANEFLSRIIAGLIGAYTKGRVFVRSTPYAVIVDCRLLRRIPDMRQIFNSMTGVGATKTTAFVESSELFRYKFLQVAKLSGVVEKKATLTKSMTDRLVDFYRNSIVYQEALRDVEKNYLDSEIVAVFISRLKGKEIAFDYRSGDSPMTREILRSVLNYREFLSRVSAGDEEIKSFEEKFVNRQTLLLCTFCGFEFSHTINLEDEKGIVCSRCGSPMVSTHNEEYSGAITKKLGGKKLKPEERRAYAEAIKETGLISSYGDRAIVALMTYGVGLVTAGRILKMVRKDKRYFIRDLIDAQKTFIRNSKFWVGK